MGETDVQNRMRTRVKEWQAALEQLRTERREGTGDARRRGLERLHALQARIIDEVREWNAAIDELDADPSHTTQREFDEQVGLREIEKQIKAEIALWLTVGHDVG